MTVSDPPDKKSIESVGRVAAIKAALESRSGEVAVAAGIGVLGLTTYLFLLLTGRVLGDAGYAPFGALWILVFLLCPAFLYPLEQEMSRSVATRRALGQGTGPLLRKAAQLGALLTVACVAVIAVCAPFLLGEFFDDDWWLFAAFVAAMIGYGVAYFGRGMFAGAGNLKVYGGIIAGEGGWRLLACLALMLFGVEVAGPYGLLVGVFPFISFLIVLAATPRSQLRAAFDDGPQASMRELSASLGTLIVASLLSQLLVNVSPLLVKANADVSHQAVAGAFAKAVVITRIPLFLFQALQAATLPRLTHFAAVDDSAGFRSYFKVVFVGVAAIGLAGVLGAWALGDELLKLFGSDTPLGRTEIALLAAGNAVFLLATQAAQGLVAINNHSRTVIGWAVGLVGFGVGMLLTGDLVMQAVMALLVGSAFALIAMLILLVDRLRLAHLPEVAELPNTPDQGTLPVT